MTGLVPRVVGAALVVAAVGSLSGCDAAGPLTPPSSSASPTAAAPSSDPAPPSATPSELTAEEDLANNPPAPTAVRAEVVDGAVTLSWQPPPAVTVPHRYSDRVAGYRIYRRGPGEIELRPVGTTTTMTYTDLAPGAGEFAYVVSSVRENDVEGTRSDPPAVVQVG